MKPPRWAEPPPTLLPLGDGLTLSVRHVKVETFTYDVPNVGSVKWDISRARLQAAAGFVVATSEVSRETLQGISARYQYDEAVVATADPLEPGLAAPLIFPETGEAMWVLIDGTHRAVKALRENVPFTVQHLSAEASRACIIEGPPELIP